MSATTDTNAGGSIAGFIYQIYYYLYRLLTMRAGEVVSLEKFEDVGVEMDESKTYYQLKHTSKTTDTKVERMSNRDTDLWKTLSMWVDKIKEGRSEEEQKAWIGESDFVLLSNKATEDNVFFNKVKAYQDKGEWDELKSYIEEQAAKRVVEETEKNKDGDEKKKTICTYTNNVNDYPLLKEFLLKVRPEFKSDDDIRNDIDYLLVNQQHFRDANAKRLRETLYGRLAGMLKGGGLEFDLESFHGKFGELFAKMEVRKFVVTNKTCVIPDNPKEQTFIKQLVDIDDYMVQNIDDIKNLTIQKLRFENDYNEALDVSDPDDRVIFERDVKSRWNIKHKKHNKGVDESTPIEDVKKAAMQVVDSLREEELLFDRDRLNSEQSNGCFYYFSDGKKPKIGWRYDWKDKYNGEEWITE